VHTQFTGFGDDGNELRKSCSVKINTRPEDTHKWIESFREKIIEIYDLEERPVQHGFDQLMLLILRNVCFFSLNMYQVLGLTLFPCYIW
jgi:hypothetical protein